MTIADLHETQIGAAGGTRSVGGLVKGLRLENSTGHGPEDPGAGPSHAFEEAATVDAVFVVIVRNDV